MKGKESKDSKDDVASRIYERIMRDPIAREGYRAGRELVELGRSLREARNQLGATQAEITKRARMTQAELNRLENGLLPNGVMYTTLARLTRVLGRQVVLQR
jgi:ribosome-binding protein aMBF1 (putative translation factor)